MENLSNFVMLDGYVYNVNFKDKSINFTLKVPNSNGSGPKSMYFPCYVIDKYNLLYCQNYLEEGIKVRVIGMLQKISDNAKISIIVQSIQLRYLTQFLRLSENEYKEKTVNKNKPKPNQETVDEDNDKVPF